MTTPHQAVRLSRLGQYHELLKRTVLMSIFFLLAVGEAGRGRIAPRGRQSRRGDAVSLG
ncbi:hypothetical protein ACIBJI_32730 [Nocardia sp. NPDC050408]|uniref:hypothetical protein n=1 Tax=Nocardia sp. NPDC050408 TaxID=3364319 RepID=UPI00378D0BDA